MEAGEQLEPQDGEAIAELRPEKLRKVKPSELLIRFVFGAGVSIVASLTGQLFGPVAGGMFLAFPAILPATLTLLEKKHGTEDAAHDDRGAVLGGAGLVAFALVAAGLFVRSAAVLAIVTATLAWTLVSLALYIGIAVSSRARRAEGPERG